MPTTANSVIDAYFLITNYCKYNCSFCYAGRPKSKCFISLDVFKELIDFHQGKSICVTGGGDPFEHPDLIEILDYSCNHCSEVHIYTAYSNELIRYIDENQKIFDHNRITYHLSMNDSLLSQQYGMIQYHIDIKNKLLNSKVITTLISYMSDLTKEKLLKENANYDFEEIPLFNCDKNIKMEHAISGKLLSIVMSSSHFSCYSSDGKCFDNFERISEYQRMI